MLTVVTWKWLKIGYRSSFTAEHVNTLKAMVARHYPDPHRFVCVTDDSAGLDEDIETIEIGDELARIKNPSWPKGPSCYRRLRMFSHEFGFGPRIVSLDLDTVITGDLRPIFNRPEPMVLWADPLFPQRMYCGSMVLFNAEAFDFLYRQFDPDVSPRLAHEAGCMGSDQGWISYKLGPNMPVWTAQDGVYSFRVHFQGKDRKISAPPRHDLPGNARIVFFHGAKDPWHPDVQRQYPWITDHWR